jgi:hypothetical protein
LLNINNSFLLSFLFIIFVKVSASQDTLDIITVKSTKIPQNAVINQKTIEQSVGIVEDMNTLIMQKPGVSSVPEAGSLLLVNADGPFDNMYLIRGIPIFAPSNFAGHTYADRSVVSLSLPNNINVYTSQIPDYMSGASGAIISIDPCILKTPNKIYKPEAALGISTFTTDLSVNFPTRNAKDRYQISYNVPNSYSLIQKSYSGEYSNLGYGIPASSWNIRTLGEQTLRSVKIKQLFWLGQNIYGKDQFDALEVLQGYPDAGKKYPWGIFVVSAFDSVKENPWNASIGCSKQNYFEAFRIDSLIPSKWIERNNIAFNAHKSILNGQMYGTDIGMTGEMLFWKGEKSLINSNTDSSSTINEMKRRNNSLQLHAGYKKTYKNFQLRINSNQGFYNSGNAFFIDPGISVVVPTELGTAEWSTGIISCPADIRGMPGKEFDDIISHTYNSYFIMNWKNAGKIKLTTEIYAKYRDRFFLYSNSAINPYWDINRKASFKAAGMNFAAEWKPVKRFGINTEFSAMKTILTENGKKINSDWDIPWATTTSLKFGIIPDRMNMFLIGTFYSGMPYRDLVYNDNKYLWSSAQYRMPFYKSIDLKWELREPTDGDFVTEYDGFFIVQNLTNSKNIRGYYWVNDEKTPITLQPITLNLGIRVNFRFLYW